MPVLEFTGERVVPGRVDADLWNEHLARYLFATRVARGKRVVDLGCGAGYGTAELSRTATSVLGVDLAEEAVAWAREQYTAPNTRFEQASCEAVPLADESVDLVVSFEVIEHLEEPENLLKEVRRILAPNGQFIVSTPNIDYYAESRETTGPNPYHHHEFSFNEFRETLNRYFPYVTLYTQNHVPAIAFQPIDATGAAPIIRMQKAVTSDDLTSAHFFIAVCSLAPADAIPGFFYLPSTGNVLREREKHITQLESLLQKAQHEHQKLLEIYHAKEKEFEAANQWALSIDADMKRAQEHIGNLNQEIKTAADLLDARQLELEDRTRWALSLNSRLQQAAESKWIRLGRKLNIGPDLG